MAVVVYPNRVVVSGRSAVVVVVPWALLHSTWLLHIINKWPVGTRMFKQFLSACGDPRIALSSN